MSNKKHSLLKLPLLTQRMVNNKVLFLRPYLYYKPLSFDDKMKEGSSEIPFLPSAGTNKKDHHFIHLAQ